MWLLLIITVPCLAIAVIPPAQECFDEAATKYITCKPVHGRPDVCDCTKKLACYIKMILSKRNISGSIEYLVNQTFQGPTIIVEQHGIVVVDFSNEMDEDTSIHFHGIRNRNVNWLDGMANITQYPIPANGKFRYIIRANPQGTHWYHSHTRYQRDNGLFGAFIVFEASSDIHSKLGPYEDQPARKTLTIVEQRKLSDKVPRNTFCYPDGTDLPPQFYPLSFVMNGKRLPGNVLGNAGNERHTQFYVVGGKNYRFRIIGAMYGVIVIISIDYHKMYVMATDGYPVKPFETDLLIMHGGERYDFILKAKKDVPPGSKYPINIQSLAANCKNYSELCGEGFAFLVYANEFEQTRPLFSENLIVQNYRCGNESKPCTILNCPFKTMPNGFSNVGHHTRCYDLLSLELLFPTPYFKTPSSVDSAKELFFNFESLRFGPSMTNGVGFKFPEDPILESKNHENECKYPVKCEEPGERICTHSVYLDQFGHATRFVLSSIKQVGKESLQPNSTHPIHIHGRQFFIAKIGYPEYDENGKVKDENKDLKMPACGPAEWKDGTPGDIFVTSTTVRKDTVMIPSGGYVVIQFFQDNPGYWYMHCHMSWHNNHGMAMAIGENIQRASAPPDSLDKETGDFCFTLETFLAKEWNMSMNYENVATPSLGKNERLTKN